MIDRNFTAILVFSLMAFASASIASLMFVAPTGPTRHVQLERVVITAKRDAGNTVAQTQAMDVVNRTVQ